MKKLLAILVLPFLLVGCATSTITNVDFDAIEKIENEDYIIVAFSGYQRSTDTVFEAQINNYTDIERTITDHCKKKGKNTYKTSHYNEFVDYTYGNGIKARGQRYWCAKSLKEAGKLYRKYLKDPPDEYLSTSQERFAKNSIRWIKKGRTDWIENMIVEYHERSGLSLYGKNIIKSKTKKTVTEESEIIASGSAFFIDTQGRMVTNFHVIKGCNNKSKIIYKNKEIEANLIAKDKILDLALLKSDIQNDKFIRIATQQPKKLQKVILAGHPLGKMVSDDLKVEDGIITSLKGPGDDSTLIQTNVATNFGNSGGPIVYEESGELVAVAVSGLRKDLFEGINFGIKATSVRNFLQSNRIDIASTSNKINFSKDNLVDLLESSTLYTFCKN